MAKKYEFRPDKTGQSFLDKFHLTQYQRKSLLKWLLYALVLLALSVFQDVILSNVRFMGATTDLVPCGIVLICLMEGAESGCVFVLVASLLYLFSGSAPGFYTVPILTALASGVTIFQQSYLHKTFSTLLLCTTVAMFIYELSVFTIGLVVGLTLPDRLTAFCLTAGMSLLAVPVLYPFVRAIGKIGGETWKD